MLTCTANPAEPGDLDSSCRGVEAADKPAAEPAKTLPPASVAETVKTLHPFKPALKLATGVPANMDTKTKSNIGMLVMLLDEAKRTLAQAQKEAQVKQNKVVELEKKLADVLEHCQKKPLDKVQLQSEEERRAVVRRRWRVLVMKVRVGITANSVKKRKINDPNSFMARETEAVKKEDELDLEGACKRKTRVKGKWRRSGFGAGITQGRDHF